MQGTKAVLRAIANGEWDEAWITLEGHEPFFAARVSIAIDADTVRAHTLDNTEWQFSISEVISLRH